MCEFMIKYCENIRPDANGNNNGQEQKNAVKAEDINLQKQKGWEKEAKSGCVVIVGKKQLADEEVKKPKKEKKVKVEENDDSIYHSIDSMNRFHDLKVLPPSNASEIDQTIKQLRDKIEILNKPS